MTLPAIKADGIPAIAPTATREGASYPTSRFFEQGECDSRLPVLPWIVHPKRKQRDSVLPPTPTWLIWYYPSATWIEPIPPAIALLDQDGRVIHTAIQDTVRYERMPDQISSCNSLHQSGHSA